MATRTRALVLVPLTLAGALCFAGIGSKSLWGDETYSVALARSGWGELWHIVVNREANMSLYYVLLKLWTAFGSSETWVRSLSALFAVAAVPVVYALGARLFDRVTGVVAALLLAVDAFFVHYAQETRGYSLVLLLVALSTYLFVVALEEPAPGWIAAYALVSAAAVYAHFFAVFVLAAQGLTLLLTRRFRHRVWVGLGGAVVLVAPLLLFVAARNSDQISWIVRPTPRDLVNSVEAIAGGSRALLLAYAILVAVALAATLQRRTTWVLLVASVVVPVGGSFVLSYAKPIFLTRYLIVSVPALVVLGAAGITRLRPRVVGALALAAVLVLSARTLRYWYADYKKEDWRAATHLVLARDRPGDVALFYRPSRRVAFEYYLGRERGRPPAPLFPHAPYGHFDLLHDRVGEPRYSLVLGGRVWLVRGNYPAGSADGRESARIERSLARGPYRRQLRRVYTGEGAGIVVELYTP